MADHDPLEQIRRKCEQYWNENHVGAPEVHAILEFIHVRVAEVKVEVERLESEVKCRKDIDGPRTYKAGVAEGMEAAAVIADEFPSECNNSWIGKNLTQTTGYECSQHNGVATAIRAAAKDKTCADGASSEATAQATSDCPAPSASAADKSEADHRNAEFNRSRGK